MEPAPYGAQRGRLGMTRKTAAGKEMVGQILPNDRNYTGPLDPNSPLPRRARGVAREVTQNVKRLGKRTMTYFSANGKRIGSLRTVRTRPLLKEWLKTLGNANVKDSTLAKRLLKVTREGKAIPPRLVSAHASQLVQSATHRLRSNEVSHHNLVNPDR